MATHTPLYDQDFSAWTQQQAALLRARNWHQLDYDNVAEELEALGKRDRPTTRRPPASMPVDSCADPRCRVLAQGVGRGPLALGWHQYLAYNLPSRAPRQNSRRRYPHET
jgi:hypothetical protein